MKSRGDKAEQLVLDYFKKRGIKAHKVKARQGYDIKAGGKLIEVKGTAQTLKQKTFFSLTENEFFAACKNKDFWLYWVNTKEGKISLKISRDELLENTKSAIIYRLYLSKLKKKIVE